MSISAEIDMMWNDNHKVDVIITVYNERRPEKFRLEQDLHP